MSFVKISANSTCSNTWSDDDSLRFCKKWFKLWIKGLNKVIECWSIAGTWQNVTAPSGGSGYRDWFTSDTRTHTHTYLSLSLSLVNTFKRGESTGSDKRGGMKPLYPHDSVEEIPPSLVWKVFTSSCAMFPLTTRGWRLTRVHETRRYARAAAAWPGMTAQECAVRRRGGPATFTHARGRIDQQLDRAGVDSHRLNWRRFVCRLLLTRRRMNLFTSWVSRAWITCVLVTCYAQVKTFAAQTWGRSLFTARFSISTDTSVREEVWVIRCLAGFVDL